MGAGRVLCRFVVVAEDGDLLDSGAAVLFGGFELGDEGQEFRFTALVEVDEGDAQDAASAGAVAHRAKRAEDDGAGIDVQVDEGVGLEVGEVGQAEQAAVGAEVEDAAGQGGVGVKAADGGVASVAVARRLAVLGGPLIGGHLDLDSHGWTFGNSSATLIVGREFGLRWIES
jgi:hypothetical protein